jgi:hypothetical protein
VTVAGGDDADRSFVDDPAFVSGSLAALEGFRDELLRARGHIENEDEPAFDVIVDLLERTIAVLRSVAR